HVLDELRHRFPQHHLNFGRCFGHTLRRLFPLLLPDLGRDSFELIRHAKAHVLPRKAEFPCDVFNGRVIGRIVEAAQPPCRVLAQARVRGEERMDKLSSLLPELPEPVLDGLQSRYGKQMDSDLEWKADVVKKSPDFTIEP